MIEDDPETVSTWRKSALVICSKCGAEMPDKAAACTECGGPLQAEPEARSTVPCTHCGAQVSGIAIICPRCGQPPIRRIIAGINDGGSIWGWGGLLWGFVALGVVLPLLAQIAVYGAVGSRGEKPFFDLWFAVWNGVPFVAVALLGRLTGPQAGIVGASLGVLALSLYSNLEFSVTLFLRQPGFSMVGVGIVFSSVRTVFTIPVGYVLGATAYYLYRRFNGLRTDRR
jgi:ribosomal protein L40E